MQGAWIRIQLDAEMWGVFRRKHSSLSTTQNTHLFQKPSFILILITNSKIGIKHPKSAHVKMNTLYNYFQFKLQVCRSHLSFIP